MYIVIIPFTYCLIFKRDKEALEKRQSKSMIIKRCVMSTQKSASGNYINSKKCCKDV